MKKIQYLFIAVIIALSALASKKAFDSNLFEVTKNIEIFTKLFKELNTYYVDELDPNKIMKTGIDAMLESLDPYTNYISENQIERYRYMTEGKYDGIGSKAEKIDGEITLIEIFKNMAADKAGLKVGDVIKHVEGKPTEGLSVGEVNDLLRGVPGTSITLGIQSLGAAHVEEVTLNRGTVNVPNVTFSGMVSENVGYISLSTFTQNASKNVAQALNQLKTSNPEMNGVILDLRNNGGGLLTEAIGICNIFIDKGEEVVTTKGKIKDWDREYKTHHPPMDAEIPLAIIINDRSASASEIVAGVVQDLDRGVLVGQRSFGKGLVQNTRDVGYNSKVKLTTAKYYIPSGRCIQSVEYENGEPRDIPDDQRAVFKTQNGRPVLDGGGVTPDVRIEDYSKNDFLSAISRQYIIFKFVNEHYNGIDSIGVLDEWNFDDFESFIKYYNTLDFEYTTKSEKELKDLIELISEENRFPEIEHEIEAIKQMIALEKADDFEENKHVLQDMIEREVAARYFYQKGKIQVRLDNDEEISTAISILNDAEKYSSILNGVD